MKMDYSFKDPCNFVSIEPELSSGSIEEWLSIVKNGKKIEKGSRRSDFSTKVKKHLSALGWVFSYALKGTKRELRYKSPNGKWFYSLATACMSCCVDEEEEEEQQQIVPEVNLSSSIRNRSLESSNFVEIVPNVVDSVKIVPESKKKRKRAKEWETQKGEDKNRSSDLIKFASCFNESDQQEKTKKRKRVKDCDYTASFVNGESLNEEEKREDTTAFNKGEARPRIGKSLRKILEVMDKKKGEKESLRFWRKDCGSELNCDVCCVCHIGGELLLCDGCPSAFHHTCLGLSSLPEEDLWFCPCCCCGICKSIDSPHHSMLMSCEQCQSRFHLKCLKEEGSSSCAVSWRGWFCSSQCDRVFTALENLLGCKISLSEDLVWRLMRAPSEYEHYDDDDERISKLDFAVEILHQGFEPTKDPFSGNDLVEELIFRRDRGFYTVILERKNEPVMVATIRVRKNEAEIPFVTTLWNQRRKGMCRLLMNELEKQMCAMGVCRLVLPAAQEIVTTWTQRFGFSVMESSERLEVVKHGMLDFVGTLMCQKFLLEKRKKKKKNKS